MQEPQAHITPEQRSEFLSKYRYIDKGLYDLSADVAEETTAPALLNKEMDRIAAIDFSAVESISFIDILKAVSFNGWRLSGSNPALNPAMDELSARQIVFSELILALNSKENLYFSLIQGSRAIPGNLVYERNTKVQLQMF
jgi:hypothetical protein